jgi:peptide/nickel transport system permease protein
LHGNLGISLATQQPVRSIVATRVPITFELIAFALLLSIIFSIPLAILAAHRPGHIVDRIIAISSMLGLSIPGYVLALVLSLLFAVHLRLLPAVGFVPLSEGLFQNLRSLLLPAVTIAFQLFSTFTRLLRADLIEQVTAREYVMAGRAKGLGSWQVLLRHALRNASFGFITVVGINIGTVLGATVIVESIPGIPGLGQLLVQSIDNRDAPVVQGVVLCIACFVVVLNLLTDVIYMAVDPRIRYGRNDN